MDYLDPYVDRTDPWNISFGDPGLQPALGHVFNLAYYISIKKTSLNINIFHQFTNNSIQQFTTVGTDTIARTTFGNIGRSRNSSLSLSANSSFLKQLSINMNTSVNYVQYTSTIHSKPHTNEGLIYNISGSANFLFKGWRASTNISYNSPDILVQGRTASYISNSITIHKYLLKNKKVNVGLSVNSPFREYRRSYTEIDDMAFHQMRESLSVIRRFNLSFNYMFTKVRAAHTNKASSIKPSF
jgi:hypothetical protein